MNKNILPKLLKKFYCPMSGCVIIDDEDFTSEIMIEIHNFISKNNGYVLSHFKDENLENFGYYSLCELDFIIENS